MRSIASSLYLHFRYTSAPSRMLPYVLTHSWTHLHLSCASPVYLLLPRSAVGSYAPCPSRPFNAIKEGQQALITQTSRATRELSLDLCACVCACVCVCVCVCVSECVCVCACVCVCVCVSVHVVCVCACMHACVCALVRLIINAQATYSVVIPSSCSSLSPWLPHSSYTQCSNRKLYNATSQVV